MIHESNSLNLMFTDNLTQLLALKPCGIICAQTCSVENLRSKLQMWR